MINKNYLTLAINRALESKFYQDKLSKLKPMDSKTLDLSELPFTFKDELSYINKMHTITSGSIEKSLNYHESSGTSGLRSFAWFTRKDIISNAKSIMSRSIQLYQSDNVLIRFPFSLSLPAYFIQEATYQAGGNMIPASSRNTIATYPKVLTLFDELDVSVFAGLPRELEILAETAKYMKDIDFEKVKKNMRLIIISGELVTPSRIRHLERLWDTPVKLLYGMTELGNIATPCDHGNLHFDSSEYWIEVFDDQLKSQMNFKEKGIAVITSLNFEGSTKLRFVTNDLVSIHNGECQCGSKDLEIRLYGRAKERFKIGNTLLDSAYIHEIVYSLPEAPIAWKLVINKEQLIFYLQYSNTQEIDKPEFVRLLRNQLPNCKVNVNFDRTLFDFSSALQVSESIKPRYIQHFNDFVP